MLLLKFILCLAVIDGPWFVPGPGPENAMVERIGNESQGIYCQYYGATRKEVGDALVAAHKRGVPVHCIVDKSNLTQAASFVPDLVKAGIPVLVDNKPPIAHNKVTILVGLNEVLEGSYNPTNQARHNAENLQGIIDAATVESYLANWHAREAVSEPWKTEQRKRK